MYLMSGDRVQNTGKQGQWVSVNPTAQPQETDTNTLSLFLFYQMREKSSRRHDVQNKISYSRDKSYIVIIIL
jgi:hypothetical protein